MLATIGGQQSNLRFDLMGLSGIFVAGDVDVLGGESVSYRLVCTTGVLHHTPSLVKGVKEVFRVLERRGRFIAMFYHRNRRCIASRYRS